MTWAWPEVVFLRVSGTGGDFLQDCHVTAASRGRVLAGGVVYSQVGLWT